MLDSKDKPTTTANIDTIVSAELPDKEQFPHCFKTVVNAMIHGPCGDNNPNAPCMIRSKKGNSYCSLGYPRCLQSQTTIEQDVSQNIVDERISH